ncbi:Mechanosensitive ion channel protein 1, mitochondrial [Linum perenne]
MVGIRFLNRMVLRDSILPARTWQQVFQSHSNSTMLARNSTGDSKSFTSISPALPGFYTRRTTSFSSISPLLIQRSYFSTSGGKSDKPSSQVSAGPGTDVGDGSSGIAGGDWMDTVKDVWHSATNAFNYTTEKAKETSDALTPHVQHVLDSYPYLKTVVVPVSYILFGTVFAWVVIPKLLRTFQRFSMQSPGGVLYTSIVGEVVPYDKSAWGALEDPVRYLITFMAFSQTCTKVAPTTLAEQYIGQVWKGAITISFVWFLYRWKANIISRAMASRDLEVADREKLVTFDKFFSIGLFVIGLTACAETFGVAVQSILTVGGIGGVATAFAARDVLGNVLSGLSIQASKPFLLGDTIKASEVIEMGLTTTMLRNSEKFPVIVPNSLFSSQVIVNKSRARFRAMVKQIPVVVDDVHKIGKISTDIESMLKSNPKVFSLEEKEKPYCFLSRIESSFAELTLGCNLNHMSKYECYNAEQEILLESARIIKENGAKLGST